MTSFYARKLVQSGLSSLVVALPNEFIKEHKLKRGDSVTIKPNTTDGTLLVSAGEHVQTTAQNHVKVIAVEKRPLHLVERDIIRAYVKNYNEIIVHFDQPDQVRQIKKYIGYLFALEVVHEDSTKVVARDFLNYRDTDVRQVLRRIELLVLTTLDELQSIPANPHVAEILMERDREVNRMSNMVMRILWAAATDVEVQHALKTDALAVVRLWTNNMHLEKIGDEGKRLGKQLALIHEDKELVAQLLPLITSVVALYRKTFAAVHTEDFSGMDDVLDQRQALLRDIDAKAAQMTAVPAIAIIHYCKEILSQLADICRMYRFVGFKANRSIDQLGEPNAKE